MIVLLITLIGVAALQMGRLNENLRHIARECNVKTDVIFSMRNVARERTLSMFERPQHWTEAGYQTFAANGANVSSAP